MNNFIQKLGRGWIHRSNVSKIWSSRYPTMSWYQGSGRSLNFQSLGLSNVIIHLRSPSSHGYIEVDRWQELDIRWLLWIVQRSVNMMVWKFKVHFVRKVKRISNQLFDGWYNRFPERGLAAVKQNYGCRTTLSRLHVHRSK